jgi:hypothetical protein
VENTFINKSSFGYSILVSFGAAVASTIFASILCLISSPLLVIFKLAYKGSHEVMPTGIVALMFLGLPEAYYCFKFSFVPNFLGLFCYFHFLTKRGRWRDFTASKRIYLHGILYGLIICAIGYIQLEMMMDTIRSAEPLVVQNVAKSAHTINYNDLLKGLYHFMPAAAVSGIIALKLLVTMISPPDYADHKTDELS